MPLSQFVGVCCHDVASSMLHYLIPGPRRLFQETLDNSMTCMRLAFGSSGEQKCLGKCLQRMHCLKTAILGKHSLLKYLPVQITALKLDGCHSDLQELSMLPSLTFLQIGGGSSCMISLKRLSALTRLHLHG